MKRVGYVLKVFPRFSETFILNEVLEHEREGQPLELISLRAPTEGHFHAAVASVRSPIAYVDAGTPRPQELWSLLRAWSRCEPIHEEELNLVLDADVADAAQAIRVALHVRERGIDHLHAHFGSVAAAVARIAARLAGITYSFTAHAKDIYHQDVDERALASKLADATFVVTVSDYNRRHLAERFPHAGDKLVRVYNGVDLERFPYRSEGPRGRRIVAVGRLVEKKGFADLIDACAELRARGNTFACQIVGAGPLQAELSARVSAHGLDGVVELPGPMAQEQICRVVQSARALAAPCVVGADGNRDGLPTVLLEAMALGTPCVSTPVTGIPELLEHDRTGLLVDERDPGELATALERLLDDDVLASRLARAARHRVDADFDIRRQAALLRELFATGGRAASPRGRPTARAHVL